MRLSFVTGQSATAVSVVAKNIETFLLKPSL